jgi:hypothetical protein
MAWPPLLEAAYRTNCRTDCRVLHRPTCELPHQWPTCPGKQSDLHRHYHRRVASGKHRKSEKRAHPIRKSRDGRPAKTQLTTAGARTALTPQLSPRPAPDASADIEHLRSRTTLPRRPTCTVQTKVTKSAKWSPIATSSRLSRRFRHASSLGCAATPGAGVEIRSRDWHRLKHFRYVCYICSRFDKLDNMRLAPSFTTLIAKALRGSQHACVEYNRWADIHKLRPSYCRAVSLARQLFSCDASIFWIARRFPRHKDAY